MVTLTKFRTMNKGDELVDIVDGDGKSVGVVSRSVADSQNLRMKASRVLVFDERGYAWVQRRAPGKTVHPLLYEAGIGETLHLNESYETAAKRGFSEELFDGKLPIERIVVKPAFPFNFNSKQSKRNYAAFSVTYAERTHGQIALQKEEVAEGRFASGQELESLVQEVEFSPVGLVMARVAIHVCQYGLEYLNSLFSVELARLERILQSNMVTIRPIR